MAIHRIIYITAIASLFLFYLYCDSYMPLFILLIVLILPVFTFISGYISSKKTTVGVKAVMQSVLRKDSMKFGISLSNRSIFPISVINVTLVCKTSLDETVIKRKIRTGLAGRNEKNVFIFASSLHCSIIECSIKKIKCSDALGLFSFKPKIESNSAEVVVMPDTSKQELTVASSQNYSMDSDIFSDIHKGDDCSQVFEVREYAPGDDIRRIHWRLSSKQDNLIVKEYSKPITDEAVILIESGFIPDNTDKAASIVDSILAVFLTLSDSILSNEKSISVRWYSKKSKKMFSYDIKSQWEIYSVVKQFLSDGLSEDSGVSFKEFCKYELPKENSFVYYIYDSSFFKIKKNDILHNKFAFIDVGQVNTFVK